MRIIKRENGYMVILNVNGVKVSYLVDSRKEAFEKAGQILKI